MKWLLLEVGEGVQTAGVVELPMNWLWREGWTTALSNVSTPTVPEGPGHFPTQELFFPPAI